MFDYNINQVGLADIMGVSQSSISKIIKGMRSIQKHHLDKLIEKFGEESVKSYYISPNIDTPQVQNATVTIYDAEVIEEIKEEIKEEVLKKTVVITPDVLSDPEIDIKAEYKDGNLDEYKKPIQDLLPDNHMTVYTYCDDMDPEIRSGEPVLVQLLPAGIGIIAGRMYFIDLPSGGIIRYIAKEENGKLHLKARNRNYGDMIVDREKVQSLSLVKLILHTPRAMSEADKSATELLEHKDRHLDRLLDQVEQAGEREKMLIEHILGKK
jgi:transcriptional regulator with XRE-family HTH domain